MKCALMLLKIEAKIFECTHLKLCNCCQVFCNNELKFARILESETCKDQDDNVDFGRFVFYFFSRIGGKSGAICASKRPQYGLNSGLT